jgi:endonuclease/exonuclease/phosphatase (EEP) superfamily protein YafD
VVSVALAVARFAVVVVAAIAAIWAVVRAAGWERGNLLARLITFTPYVAGGTLVPLIAALVLRMWPVAGLAAFSAAILAACVLPRTLRRRSAPRVQRPSRTPGTSGDAGAGAVRLTVMATNLWIGQADAQSIVDFVTEHEVDVLALQEFTPDAHDRLVAAGLEKLLPHSHLAPSELGTGSALFARHELTDAGTSINPGRGFRQAHAVVTAPGAVPIEVHSAHPEPPTMPQTAWVAGLRAQPAATAPGPLRILAGDFNATVDHAPLRRLLRTGYRDAATVMGRGLAPTWPVAGHRTRFVPKVTLDHVLVDASIEVLSFGIAHVPGTDHRAVIATFRLPRTSG